MFRVGNITTNYASTFPSISSLFFPFIFTACKRHKQQIRWPTQYVNALSPADSFLFKKTLNRLSVHPNKSIVRVCLSECVFMHSFFFSYLFPGSLGTGIVKGWDFGFEIILRLWPLCVEIQDYSIFEMILVAKVFICRKMKHLIIHCQCHLVT